MKKSVFALSFVMIAVLGIMSVIFAFRPIAVSSITGKVNPADAIEAIWVTNGKDSIKGSAIMGAFSIEVKPGNYSVFVDAKSPYKDKAIDNVHVMAEQSVDIGEIILQQ